MLKLFAMCRKLFTLKCKNFAKLILVCIILFLISAIIYHNVHEHHDEDFDAKLYNNVQGHVDRVKEHAQVVKQKAKEHAEIIGQKAKEHVNFVKQKAKEHGELVKQKAAHLARLSYNYVYSESKLRPIPPDLTQADKCPLCIDTSMCHAVNDKSLKVDLSVTENQSPETLIYPGRLKDQDVLVIRADSTGENRRIEEFVCKNASRSIGCDVSTYVGRTLVGKRKGLNLQGVQQLISEVEGPKLEPLSSDNRKYNSRGLCLTWRAVASQLAASGGEQTTDDTARGVYSLTVQPEASLFKWFDTLPHKYPLPRYLGACGRAFILENPGSPLSQHLTAPWRERLDLGMQLLQLAVDFMNLDPDWYFLLGDWGMSNFAVTSQKKVVLTRLNTLTVVDRRLFSKDLSRENKQRDICDEKCLNFFFLQLFFSSPRDQHCAAIPDYGDLMYLHLCRQIYTNDGDVASDLGLLHGLPDDHALAFEEILVDCISETTPGGRTKAMDYLRAAMLSALETEEGGGE